MTASNTGVGLFDLSATPLHLASVNDSESSVIALENFGFDGPAFEAYMAQHCTTGPGRLVMMETTPADWRHWECHTLGDEIVIVLQGKANFIQEVSGEETVIAVQPGSAIINPIGVWHTADVSETLKAIYITPCKGTKHREREALA